MSGTYQLSQYNSSTMELFPRNPLFKRFSSNRIATGGTREPIYSAFWQIELNFGALETQSEVNFFESRFIAGGLYYAVLPHPISSQLVGFTGVSIENVNYEITDTDSDAWAENMTVTLGFNLYATGTV